MEKTSACPKMLADYSKFCKSNDSEKWIFFVVPPGFNVEDCLDWKIGKVFEASKARALNIRWIKDEECKDQHLYSDLNIFVFEIFGSPGFEFCMEKSTFTSGDPKIEIFGPMVLQAIFDGHPNVKTIENWGCAVHNLPSEGITICLTDLKEEHDQNRLEMMIRMMNGEISANLTKTVNFVVTGTALSEMCMTARAHEIPVKTFEWITQLHFVKKNCTGLSSIT